MSELALAAPRLEPGVSLELARWRSRLYRDIRYALDIDLRAGSDVIAGRAEIRMSFARSPQDLVLDWRTAGALRRVRDLSVNGRPLDSARFESEHLVIPREALKRGENVVSLRFESTIAASGSAVTRYVDREDGAEYLYSLFVPAEASTAFPCIDQPDLKARFTLTVTAPAGWQVISNSPLAQSTRNGALARHRFRETEPISTYLFAFAAGPFAQIGEPAASAAPREARPGAVRLFVRRSQLARAQGEAPEILRLNRAALDWFARYFGARFPFAKYDLVLIPELAYGGMEHAGATFLREESVLFPFEPNASDLLRRSQLVLHEASHQWFGDLVTMRWFDDLWLKEGFANFMAAKATEALLPQYRSWIAFGALKAAAYRTDATRGTTPIWHALDNLASAKSAYGNIVYAKAPAVLRQTEFYVGERAFRRGVRDFLRRHAYASADWSDLLRALERASGQELKRWAQTWVKARGMARIRLERQTDDAGRLRHVVLIQENALGERVRWPMRLQLAALARGKTRLYEVRLGATRTRVATPGAGKVDLAFANHGDYGYGQFLLDPASRAYALANPDALQDALLRSLAYDSLWESVREAELDPASYIELALQRLPLEPDEIIANAMLARLRTAFLRYLSPERRAALAPQIETFLAAEMRAAHTASRRIGYFRAFVQAARSAAGRAALKDLLFGRAEIPQVRLRSRDRFDIIRALLAAGDAEAPALLEAQSREDSSGEGRRYAFAARAAHPDAAVKQEYFERFLADRDLPESWIEEALGPLNEFDHASLTRPLLERALYALPRLNRERKIFFVNDWLGAFLGGQSSAEAIEAVERFLAGAALDEDLRHKVLEALDALERTVKIRSRFGSG